MSAPLAGSEVHLHLPSPALPDLQMLGLYLFALVLGGGLLVFSVVGGGADGGHDAGHAGHHEVPYHGPGDLVLGFFRPRNIVFFLAAFGLTGASLTWLGRSAASVAGFAVGMGLGAMVVNHLLFTWLRRTDAAIDTFADADLEGVSARVVLDVQTGHPGRVVCVVGGREHYVTARLASGVMAALPAGREVVIVAVQNGVAEVAPLDLLSSSSPTSLAE